MVKLGIAPGAGFATSAVARYLLARQRTAAGILRSQLERAGATAADFRDSDQLAAAAVRYTRAARDQAADENLTLLAQAMIGIARQQQLWASDFLKYAEILAPLSRDELILIGRMMAEDSAWHRSPEEPDKRPTVWHMVTTSSKLSGLFPDNEYLEAVAGRAQRSGLILPKTGWGTPIYELSPIGRAVRGIVDIDAALRETRR